MATAAKVAFPSPSRGFGSAVNTLQSLGARGAGRLFCSLPVSVQQNLVQVWYGHSVSRLHSRLAAFEKSSWVSRLAVFTSLHLRRGRS